VFRLLRRLYESHCPHLLLWPRAAAPLPLGAQSRRYRSISSAHRAPSSKLAARHGRGRSMDGRQTFTSTLPRSMRTVSTRPFLRVNRGDCPRSEIKCPHSEHGNRKLGGQKQIACPSRTIPRTDVSTCYHAPADHIQGSLSMAEIPNL